MKQIVVDDQQAKIIEQSVGVIEVLDRNGRRLGVISNRVTAEDIAIAKQRAASSEPRLTTEEVLNRLSK